MLKIAHGLKRRTKSRNDDQTAFCQFWSTSGGSAHKTSSATYHTLKDNFYLTGYDIPNFHKKVSKGYLMPQTPFYIRETTGSTTGVYDITHNSTGVRSWSVGPYCEFTNWVPGDADSKLQSYLGMASDGFAQEAAAKIYSSGHDTLTFLAELASVRGMFLNVGKRLIKQLPFLPKGGKGVSSDWLSYRYGWRTLIYDLQDLNKAIVGLNSGRQRYSEKTGITNTYSSTNAWQTNGSDRTRYHTEDDKIIVGLRGSVVADVSIPQFQFNPLQTGWELIPFSFVIDWFLNVGKAMAAWSFLSLQSDYTASYGISVEYHRAYNTHQVYDNYSGDNWQSGTSVSVIRQRFPCEIPYLPHMRIRLDGLKVLDLLGLIVQRR